jgi:hypothetical protein
MLEERCALGVAIDVETGMLVAAGGYGGRDRYLSRAEWLNTSRSHKEGGCNAAVVSGFYIGFSAP